MGQGLPSGWHRGLHLEAQVPMDTLLGASEPWQQHPHRPAPTPHSAAGDVRPAAFPSRACGRLGGVPVSSEAWAGTGPQAFLGLTSPTLMPAARAILAGQVPPATSPVGSWWNPAPAG